MLQGVSGHGAAAAEAHESGGDGSYHGRGGEVGGVGSIPGGFNEEEKGRSEEGERNSGGNRWPRQETIALLKIRSDMDIKFRDSSLKGPLWEDVSRKLAELGYHRSAKKCKEKFENVYKYHKRTKDGRTSKSDGKTYRFFDQLVALESHPPPPLPPLMNPQPQMVATTMAVTMPGGTNNPPLVSQTISPTAINPVADSSVITTTNPTHPYPRPPPQSEPQPIGTEPPTNHAQSIGLSSSHPNVSVSNSTSSSTSSDEEPERRRKRKRKWKDFAGRLMKEVIEKQEELQKKFLEALDKRERDRMIREEAWRVQKTAQMNREHDLLVQERSIVAAKDAAVIAFLQKITQQQIPDTPNAMAQSQMQVQNNTLSLTLTQPRRQPDPPAPAAAAAPALAPTAPPMENTDNGGESLIPPSPSRWPKAEIQALIHLRTTLDLKYLENGPKGPLWEEISVGMRKLGYNRSSKRCKEKWENINKYYKKMKESNKKRPEDAKTCPYFHQLEAIYKERSKTESSYNSGLVNKPENPMVAIMVRPEQQWPLPQEQAQPESDTDEPHIIEGNNEGADYESDENEGDGDEYEIVANKPSSMGAAE